MAEFFSKIATEPANKSAAPSGDAAHYNLPVYEWFGNDARYGFPTSITADFGDANNPYYVATHNIDFQRYGPLFSTPDVPEDERGFEIKKTSASDVHSALVEIQGGTGHWMPAPIFRTLSFFWKNYTSVNANYRVYTPGLTLRNWKTNATQRWTVGWENAANSNASTQIFKVSGLNKAEQINALGPDWYIYGVWFYLLSNSTGSNQTARSLLSDVRFGWHNSLPSGAYKMVIPDKMSWDDFRALKQRGEASFYSLNKPVFPIAEWDWKGTSSDFDDTKMCDKPGTSFTWSSNSVTYFAETDRNGDNIISAVTDAYNEKGTLWYKHDDSPAYSVPAGRPPQIGPAYCHYVHNGVNVNGPAASGGVLRAYAENPDA